MAFVPPAANADGSMKGPVVPVDRWDDEEEHEDLMSPDELVRLGMRPWVSAKRLKQVRAHIQ